MSRQDRTCFTVGHSNHTLEKLCSLLAQHGVTAVADVRSSPYSRLHPQFNREQFAQSLKALGIHYVYLGRELGGRTEDPTCYVNGRVHYPRLAQTDLFRQGLRRVIAGTRDHCVALMCAEKEPLECHRTLLVAPALAEAGQTVTHIHADGRGELHEAALERLLSLVGLPRQDLFRSREELIAEALERQANRVAYADKRVAGGASQEAV